MRRPCSANEVLQIARKACIGSGLAVDRAEDLAEAATLLQCSGHDGLAQLLVLLEGHEAASAHLPATVQIDSVGRSTDQLRVRHLRPHIEGVAVIDWLLANPQTGTVFIEKTDDKMLLIGLLVCAIQRFGGVFILQASHKAEPFTIRDASQLKDGLPETEVWTLSYKSGQVASPAVLYHHTDTDLSIWEALEARANLTYVPATETSRQKGAGAGLVDND
jgi:hypothetical protein